MTRHSLTAAALGMTLTACAPDDSFERIGYFKDARPNRVFVIAATGRVTADEVRAHAADLPHTDGAQTVAYIFEAGSSATDNVSRAADVAAAHSAMFASGTDWRWRYLRTPNGQWALIDCATDKQDGHCR